MVQISAGLDCAGFRRDARVCKFHASDHSVNASVVPSRGFGSASFCVFQLRVQEGTASSTLSATHRDPVAESLLNIGDVVVRCQDTSRTSVGDLGMTQVLDSCDLLPGTLSSV